MDTINYIIISPNVIVSVSNVNSKLDITSDHRILTVTLTSKKLRPEDRNISLKLHHMADWSKVNENIKSKLNKFSGIFDTIKRSPKNEIKLFLDELANKLIEIIYHEMENNIPEIKNKDRDTYLPEYIRQKINK